MRLLVGDPIDLRVETTRKNVKKKYVESSSIRLFKDNREVKISIKIFSKISNKNYF